MSTRWWSRSTRAGGTSSTGSTRSRGSAARCPPARSTYSPRSAARGSPGSSSPTACSRRPASARSRGRPSGASGTTTSGSRMRRPSSRSTRGWPASGASWRDSGGADRTGRPRVFVTRVIPDEGLEPIRAACDMDLWEDPLPPPRDELLRRVAGVDGALTLLTDRVDDEFLDAAGPGLRVVSNYAVGFDNIDVAACARRGIPVGNTPGVLTETTADLAWALMMAAARRLPEGDRYVRAGSWKTWGPMLLLGPDVHGATIGIVGFGRIGQAVARRAQGFGMRILYHDLQELPSDVTSPLGVTYDPLEALLAESDFVSLHVNLSPATTHLIDAESLSWMKPTAVLVNTSRGPVVDQAALADALDRDVIFGAALDVTDPEPIPMDDRLVGRGDCLTVRHSPSASRATRGKMAAMAAANLLAGVSGRPLPTEVPPPA